MKKFFLSFFIALLLTVSSFSQSKWSFGLMGGYDLPVSDLKGSLPDTLGSAGAIDFTIQRNYFTTKGFGIGAFGKRSFDTTGNARLTASIFYNHFSQSKDYSRPQGGLTSYSNQINIFSITAGAEYNFRPVEKINPFVGLELSANFFSGKIEATGDTTITINRKSESRFGINANAGIDIKLKKDISILLGAKFCMNNLFGKSYETINTTGTANKDTNPTGTSTTPYELPLNDGDHGALQSLSINHIQIFAGVSFSFGNLK